MIRYVCLCVEHIQFMHLTFKLVRCALTVWSKYANFWLNLTATKLLS